MKCIYLILFIILNNIVLAQNRKVGKSQFSKIDVKGNNNIVRVVQAGSVIEYNILDKRGLEKLAETLLKFPSVKKSILKIDNVDDKLKKQQETLDKILNLLISSTKIGKRIVTEESINLYIDNNEDSKEKLKELKKYYENSEFEKVLSIAEIKLNSFDNKGYQTTLEEFKKRNIEGEKKIQKEIADVSYLQAVDNLNRGVLYESLSQINESLSYFSKDIIYLLLKGKILRSMYRAKEAKQVYESIETAEVVDSIKVLILNGLGESYRLNGDFDKGIDKYKEEKRLMVKLGVDNSKLATVYNNIGLSYTEKGDLNAALDYLETSLDLKLNANKKNYESIANAYDNIGAVYKERKEYERALMYYRSSLELLLNNFGVYNTHTARVFNYLSSVFIKIGDYDEAISYADTSLAINSKLLGEDHYLVALSYSNMGEAYMGKKNFDKAYVNQMHATSIVEKIPGISDIELAANYGNTGMIYYYTGRFSLALHYFELAYSLNKVNQDGPHLGKQSYLNMCAMSCVYGKNPKRALSYLEVMSDYKILSTEQKFNYFSKMVDDFFLRGDYEKSIDICMLLNSILEFQRLSNSNFHVKLYEDFAKIYCIMGNKDFATSYFIKSMNVAKLLKNKEMLTQVKGQYKQCVSKLKQK